jgi:4-amino-4-deoxy-L-arabinose transferase-like glycosyltransferase
MTIAILKSRSHIFLVFCAFLVFLIFTFASSLTNRPQVDEGLFASPAHNLATKGHFGTTVLEIEGSSLTRIDRRTYWVMPLFLLNVSASFEAFGMSLFSMRLVSVFWGLVLLAAWYFIILKLSGNRNVALLGLFLLATNYTVLDTASLGRMDIMSAALGFAALAVYLNWRERNLLTAILLGQCFVVLSGLTHPNGIFAFFGLLFLIFYLDFRRLDLKIAAAGLIPYFVGGAAFGIWIWQDFEAFRAQFIDNAMMSGRMSSASSPLMGIVREFTEKYPHAYGLGATSGGHSGPIYLKSLILVGYIAGVLGLIFTKSLRQNKNYFILLVLTAIYFVVMALIDGQKQTPYLIHIVPFYCALLAIWIEWAWQRKFVPRIVLILAVAAFAALQIGGLALRIRQNTYAKVYRPAVKFLRENTKDNEMIFGSPTLGFELGFQENLIGDPKFGMTTGKRPRILVFDDESRNSWQESQKFYPEYYEYLPRLLNEEYKIIYENAAFQIYELR